MKSWREIEEQLKTENHRDEIPDGLHDRIMRAVRDDRAAASIAAKPSHFAQAWLWAAAAATAVIAIAMIAHRTPPRHPGMTAELSAPAFFSLASLEDFATSPVNDEVNNLRADISSAASFIQSCLPSGEAGT